MSERVRKPEWLKISIAANERYAETKRIVDSHCLHTICSSGRCPNMGECWGRGTATFMIAGDICTRSCKFCNTRTGHPLPPDEGEPLHVAESVRLMKLSHAVITSVDRDDLPDLGAGHWARTVSEIRRLNPDTTIEALIPDFQGRRELGGGTDGRPACRRVPDAHHRPIPATLAPALSRGRVCDACPLCRLQGDRPAERIRTRGERPAGALVLPCRPKQHLAEQSVNISRKKCVKTERHKKNKTSRK